MMCITTEFAMVGIELSRSEDRRRQIVQRLSAGGRTIIDLTHQQIRDFAGGAIELLSLIHI